MMMMQAATSSTPVMEISESDGNWIMRTWYTDGYKSRLCPKINFILMWLYVAVLLYSVRQQLDCLRSFQTCFLYFT